MICLSLFIPISNVISLANAQPAEINAPQESEWIVSDFRFGSGEVLPELRLHYTAIEIADINRILRRVTTDSIRNDPAWQNGDYEQQPIGSLITANYVLNALFADERYLLIPRTQKSNGHGSYRLGRLYADYVREILR